MDEKEIADNLKKSIQKLSIYNNVRVVKSKHTYIDSDGCYTTSNNKRFAVVNGGKSSYVLFDEDNKKFVDRKEGKLSYLGNLGLSILVGMVGGGSLHIKPTKTEIIAEIQRKNIIYHTYNPLVIKTIKNLESTL